MSVDEPREESLALIVRGKSTSPARQRRDHTKDDGFTLIELLIVVGITPLIIGALAIALISIFSLQTNTSNRLTDTGQAQVLQSSFRTDVASAEQVTTDPAVSQCGSGTQLLGFEWNENAAHNYVTVVSYVSVAEVDGTVSLVRNYCNDPSGATQALIDASATSTTIASDLSANSIVPSVTCVSGDACAVSGGWVGAQNIATVSFPLTETASSDSLTLVADPASSGSSSENGQPITPTTSTGCGFADPNSGYYSTSLCLVDFTSLTGNNLLAAEQGCLETSVPLPGGSTMYYCIGIKGAPVVPIGLPTYNNAFLGNQINGVPFYTDIAGDPALYQNCEGDASSCVVNGVSVPNTFAGTTTISITGIEVIGPNGNADTGWEFVSADAESTDGGESIQWTTNSTAPMGIIPNGESDDTPADPINNACNTGAGVIPQAVLTGGTSTSITCNGDSNGQKYGTLMVEAASPTSMTVKMIGTGLEGVSFGLLF